MPKDNIERAIARGAGPSADGAAYETVTYEGYGPAGIAVYVEAVTDNRNRTAADVRHIFSKADGSLGESGSVAWLFERRAVVLVDGSADEDELTLAAAEGGADDVERDGDSWRVPRAESCKRSRGGRGHRDDRGVRRADDAAEDDRRARGRVGREEGQPRLMDALEDSDVQDVYANFDIPERVLETVEP